MRIFIWNRFLPIFLFLTIWISLLILSYINPLGFYNLTDSTIFYILASVLCVTLGYATYALTQLNNENKNHIIISDHQIKRMIQIFLVLSIISSLGILFYFNMIINEMGGLSIFLSNPIKSRFVITTLFEESQKSWNPLFSLSGYATNLNYTAAMFGAVIYVFSNRYRYLVVLSILNAVFYSAVSLQRFFFVQTVLLILIYIGILFINFQGIDKKRRVSQFKWTISFSIVGMFFMLISILVLRIDFTGIRQISTEQILNYATGSIYSYFAGPLVALNQFLIEENSWTMGASMFRGVIKWLARFYIFDESSILDFYYSFKHIGKYYYLNTFTYIRPFFEDFGIFGLLIFSYLFGMTVSFFYQKVLNNFSYVKLNLAGLMVFSLIMSFYNFTLFNIASILYSIAIIKMIEMLFIKDSYY